MTRSLKYFGIDGCKAGWFYVALRDNDNYQFGILKHFNEIDQFLARSELILVDIPIGLPSASQPERVCDKEARKMISPRGSCVFPAPTRSALNKQAYKEGSEENFRVLGRRLSKQTWNISPKIKEVDDYLRSRKPGSKIREMHPEVAFCSLNKGIPMKCAKKTPAGVKERLAVLKEHWSLTETCYTDAIEHYLRREVARDDVLDALVGAVLACRPNDLSMLPARPSIDDQGLPMQIIYLGA
ncbi:MAG TPA: DUF429 domain-containing protein [Xanthomonadales bacterium]|nr:DUF429 domain-containing protein [Xanthomonadales bacterium]